MTDDLIEDGLAAAFGPDPRSELTGLSRFCAAKGIESRLVLPDPLRQSGGSTPIALPGRNPSSDALAGRYRLQGEIARGGMGQILRGHDADLGRDVAIKVMHPHLSKQSDVIERFIEEAQIGGQLQHPGIVPVYELGVTEDRPFFAMKLIHGETLAALLAERQNPTENRRRLLEVFQAVCRTMAYAHARSVLHRDLKPANILVGSFGEVQIVDWGLAKVLSRGGVADERKSREQRDASKIETVRNRPGSTGSESIVGSVLGTPAYMPPEQARGDIDRLDERADVFALGAILCEILTGAPPYHVDDGDEETIVLASRGELAPAIQRVRKADADTELQRLCEECLTPTKQARPKNAQVLADRVTAHLEAVEERAQKAELNAARSSYRQRTTLIVSAAALLLITLGAAGLLWNQSQEQARRTEADRLANAALSEARSVQVEAEADSTDLATWDRALSIANSAVRTAGAPNVDPELRDLAASLLSAVTRSRDRAIADSERRAIDRQMLDALNEARTPDDAGFEIDNRRFATVEIQRQRRNYSSLFAEYLGFEIQTETEQRTIEELRESAILNEAIAALDHWSLLSAISHLDIERKLESLRSEGQKDQKVEEKARLRLEELRRRSRLLEAIASTLDPENSWRQGFRRAVADLSSAEATLVELASKVAETTSTPADYRLLADALKAVNASDRTLALLRVGAEVHPSDFDLHVRLAIEEQQAGLRSGEQEEGRDRAIQILRIAHSLRPESVQVVLRLGLLESLQATYEPGDRETALRWLERAYDLDPDNRQAVIAWCSQLVGSGLIDEAESVLERAGSSVEQDPDLLVLRSVTRQQRGAFDLSDADVLTAYAMAPGDTNVASSFASYCIRNGLYGFAREVFDQIEKDNGSDPTRGFYEAQAQYYLGEFEEALAYYRGPGIQIVGPDGAARGEARALMALGRAQEGVEVARREGLFPDDQTALCSMAEEMWLDGLLEPAAAAWTLALRLDPGSQWAGFLRDRDLRFRAIVDGTATSGSEREWLTIVQILGRQRRFTALRDFVLGTSSGSPTELKTLDDEALYTIARITAIASRADSWSLSPEERDEASQLARDSLRIVKERKSLELLTRSLTTPDFYFVRAEQQLRKLTPEQRGSWTTFWQEIRAAVAPR